MSTSPKADQGQVQGRIVKVKQQGDGTVKFDVVCRNTKGRIAHREHFLLPPKSVFQDAVKNGKGSLARITFEKTGRDRDRPLNMVFL